MLKKKSWLMVIVLLMLCHIWAAAQTISLPRTVFRPGEDIPVSFAASPDYADNAWIGLIPSTVKHGSEAENDRHDMTYQYLKKRTSGVLTFKAPAKDGTYDFRMHDTDNNGREVAFVTFTVDASFTAPTASLTLLKTEFKPGETIPVSFIASPDYADNAWVGIIPSNVKHGSEAENDKHDLAYKHLKKIMSGTLRFRAPVKEGTYDFRMHDTDNNGKEVASVTFTVKASAAEDSGALAIHKTVYAAGEEIYVAFQASSGFADNAWVGVIPSSVKHGSEAENDKHDLTYQHLKKRTFGILVFKAPEKAGAYDLRMHDTDNNGREVASVSFEVQ